ncbi:MAG: hypothetical protein J6T84_09515 [Spirochaetaceae bacterium]|nr:hypothetical protein [Spirochaetaceae bacterium]
MNKIVIILLISLISITQLIASPAAITFDNLPKDKNFEKLFLAFGNAYNYIKNSDLQDKNSKKDDLAAAKNLYEYLNKKKKTNYDEDLLKLLVMRCLYNYDEISSTKVEEVFSTINKKYSKNAEHHWIYGNYLISQGKTTFGKEELEKYMKMKNYQINNFFIEDYAYSYLLCSMSLNAYYAITNGGNIPEEDVANQNLLNFIKGTIKKSSADGIYTSEQVWRVSQGKDDNAFVYSTMLGISIPSKPGWGLRLEPFTKEHAGLCLLSPNDFTLEGKPVTISISLIVYPESLYSEGIKQRMLNSLPIVKKETTKISGKEFEKYTFEDSSKYQDARNGALGYFYAAKIIPKKFSGVKCEHEIDFSNVKSEDKTGQVRYFAINPTQNRLDEPIEVFIIVDSCNALKDETINLLDDFFSKAVFE